MAPPRLTGGNRLPAMIGRSWATVVGAAPAMGLLAMLMFTPLVCDPPGVPVDSSVGRFVRTATDQPFRV